jgi:hypothetical protein
MASPRPRARQKRTNHAIVVFLPPTAHDREKLDKIALENAEKLIFSLKIRRL